MKLSAVVVLLAVSGASAFSTPTRGDLRQLGQKTVSSAPQSRRVGASIKMEGTLLLDFLRFKELSSVSYAQVQLSP